MKGGDFVYINGSVKSSVANEEVSFVSVTIDCEDGTSVTLSSDDITECKHNNDGYYSINQLVDGLLIDDEEVEEVDEEELFNMINGGSVFNIQFECGNPGVLSLRSLVVKFDNGMVCNLIVEESTVNSEM